MNTDNTDSFVTVKKASEILGISERTVWRKVKNREIEYEKRDKRVYVNVRTNVRVDSDTDVIDVTVLKAEIEHLKSLLDEVRNERDYLRQLVAVVYTDQKRIEEKSSWWKFWSKD